MKKIMSLFIIFGIICMPAFSSAIYQSSGLYGLKDDKGKIILAPTYKTIVQLSYTPSKKVVIPMHAMDEVQQKKLDLYKVKQNNLWGVINSNGKLVQECKYKNIEVDTNGDIQLTLTDGKVEYAHPVLNAAKATRDTFVTIIGLPVSLIGAAMIPIEAVSKAGRRTNK